MDILTLDKIFVLDNLNIVLDKKYFVRADGRGIRANFCHKLSVQKNVQRKMIAAPSGVQTNASSICPDKIFFVQDNIQIVQDKNFVQS